MEDLTKKAYNFILQCYFGDMSDPVAAAIDRAYSDMASHTLKGFKDDYKKKWECRFEASKEIYKKVFKLNDDIDYDDWHKTLCGEIKGKYYRGVELSDGQAQKWVNMTMKYLLVFDLIYEGKDEAQREKIPDFLKNRENIDKLHIPLDNYILQYYQKEGFLSRRNTSWSKMEYEDYFDCIDELRNQNKTIENELEDWCTASNENRNYDKESYQKHKKDKKDKGNTYKS